MKAVSRRFLLIAMAAALSCFSQKVSAQENKGPSINFRVQQAMTHADFQSAGLNKLTPQELHLLNQWLDRYMVKVIQAAMSASQPGAPGVPVESYIAGDFEGWSGERIFKLDNGQIWQQASYSYTYHYAYHPRVTIYRAGGGYKMKVEGLNEVVEVKRLK